MILHERKLILDPDVFSGITQDMLKELERMGAMAAVQVLTGHMVRALKERRAKTKNRDKSAKKAAKAAKKAAAVSSALVAVGSSATPANVVALDVAGTPALPPPPVSIGTGPALTTALTVEDPPADPGSPIIVIDDSGDEAPAAKRRKLNDGGTNIVETIPMAV